MNISFILLSWNSANYLSDCFKSIITKCEEEGIGFEIITIDNGSTDESPSLIRSFQNNYPLSFKPIFLSKNLGTTCPRNLGLQKAIGNYICILDSDTELYEGTLRDILNRLKSDYSVAIIAPQLLLAGGIVQNSVKKIPTLWQKIYKIPKAFFKIQTPDLDFYDDFPFTSERFVSSAISACWFFRKDLLDLIGYLDEKIFYSPEDLDFCVRALKAGKKILYFPNFKVLHHTQQISHSHPLSRISISHFWGLLYYFRKHGGWFSNRDTLA